ncbi:MAG: membrane dipeptidase [Gemmatimonadaceae bacterium]|nr:membrane dipeptidase [Gemmatimonadaceae bacterium]
MLRRIATRVLIVLIAALLGTWIVGPGMVDRKMNRVVEAEHVVISDSARRLHGTLTVADLHADELLWGRDLLARTDRGHVDLPRMREGNVALQVFSVVTKTPRNMNYDRNTAETDNVRLLGLVQRWPLAAVTSLRARAIHQADRLHAAIGRSSGALVLLTDQASLAAFTLRRAVKPDVHATLLAIEGLHALDGQLESVDTLFAHGFRMMGLVHFFDNEVAASAHGVSHGGLTPLGRAVIARMEALHITVDLAHAAPQVVDEVLAIATRPVVVSHTGVAATCPGPRNLTDAQLRAIAANGGVVGIGYWDAAVCTLGARSIATAIVHAVDIAGIDHVALGSDFDGATAMPFGTDRLAEITQALLDAQFTLPQVRAVMGGNVMRLLGENLP